MESYVKNHSFDGIREKISVFFEDARWCLAGVLTLLELFLQESAAYAEVGGTSGAGGLITSGGTLQGIDLTKSSSSAGSDFVTIINRIISLVILFGIVGVIAALVGAGYKAAVSQDNREAQGMLARALGGAVFVVCAYGLANYLQYSFGIAN